MGPTEVQEKQRWLTEDVGHPALAQQLYAVVGLMRISRWWTEFYEFIQKGYSKKGEALMLELTRGEAIADQRATRTREAATRSATQD
jgi:hypothetical protein